MEFLDVWQTVLRDGSRPIFGGPHLGQDPVEPLEGAVEVDFDPAGGRGDVLPMIISAPPFDEGHADRAHLSQVEDGLVPLIHPLGQQLSENLNSQLNALIPQTSFFDLIIRNRDFSIT